MEEAPPIAPGILPHLRTATGEAHQALERIVDVERCVADVTRYRTLLERFLGFYRPLEWRLAVVPGWEASGVDLLARWKTPWLEADLRALGLSQAEVAGVPNCAELPLADDPARGFGCLYVLEGATLGGRQITGMLRESPVPPGARHFFGSYGAETGARWREFLAALEGYAGTADDRQRADLVAAAAQTFACLGRWVEAGRLHV